MRSPAIAIACAIVLPASSVMILPFVKMKSAAAGDSIDAPLRLGTPCGISFFRGAHFGSFPLAWINDDRQVLDRSFNELLWAMTCGCVEKQGIAWLHDVGTVRVSVTQFAGKHVEELDIGMTEVRIRDGILFK